MSNDFISTLIATLIGVFIASMLAYLITEYQNKKLIAKVQDQEVSLVIQLLEVAKDDVNRSVINLGPLDNVLQRAGSSQEYKDQAIRAIDLVFATAVPYPVALKKILDDDKIMKRLPVGGLLELYKALARLESQKNHIINPCASANKKLSSMKWYKRDLYLISIMLQSEIDYQKGIISEADIFKTYEAAQKNLPSWEREDLELLIKDEDNTSQTVDCSHNKK